ncbi:uroporphyrinogen-III synthase [Tropicibacter alexandrii]|uniref:uroporphyrinogen-III synthase n=1 Tax=Tropicibacter alexandrii TaxID=2267683 RepID=UPI000EF54C10|nr:uroporphyrinogen-III synthase [Tropicibacter alexandrii]
MPDTLPILLLTRPEDASRRVVDQLREMGCAFEPVISPLIGIEVTGPLPEMEDAQGLIFTSANAVAAYRALGGPAGLPAFTVGQATAEAATNAGLHARSADGNAETLIAWLRDLRPDAPLIHMRGTHTRGDVAGRLSAAGVETRAAVIYDQPALPLTIEAQRVLTGTTPVVVPLYSPRSAKLLRNMSIKAPLLVAALSEAVANAAPSHHIKGLRIAARPDSGAFLPLVAELLAVARDKDV